MSPDVSPGPLAGLRVVELAGIGPGPFAAMLLADLGAEVVRVERPDGGNAISPETDMTRRGRRSVVLDLKKPEGRRVALDLASRADVLIEGYRPGVAEKLGLGPDDCWKRNPRLVYGRITGWGQDGPLSASAGHDICYVGITGALHAIGKPDQAPSVPLNLVGDYGGGSLFLVVGVLSAVIEAARSGKGQVVDAAIVDGTAALTTLMHSMMAAGRWEDRRGANLIDGGLPWYDVYKTLDDGFMAIGPLEPQFYTEFLELMGLDSADGERTDPQNWPQLRERIATTFATKTRDQWSAIFEGTDACVAPVLSFTEAPAHPHNKARGTFVEVDGVVQPAPAPRFSRTPATIRRGPVKPGSDTRRVLLDWGVDEVESLLDSEAAIQAPD
ncbi:CaiB/BaiF CoA-transferase family protein [Mycolicibacterium sp. CBMA 226]|uniref:CaiB/BaiF CoA transferase family protein n=1 Tax=Mycolicibacterium sp. CBMA 226 TaxID=2606611 RepID=UPI0012DF251E|nr:CaiB/BaiF CoA-transferase family protein [Mycolicibacterium sp. CBMA 226]MUL74495.1 CoA transferase [Mycolicibacterium sp. CBMA 226]